MQAETNFQPIELRSDVVAEARKLIEDWHRGLTVVASYYRDSDAIVLVAKDDVGAYHVTSFFLLGARWVHSADAQAVSADEAFRALTLRLN